MKKIIIAIISAMILIPTMSDAQIQVNKQPKREIIKSLRMGGVSLWKTGESYYLGIYSNNKFDKTYVIFLGEGKDAATESINSFIEISSNITKDDQFEFSDQVNNYFITKGMFKGEIWFKTNGYAGYGITTTSELNNLLKALTNSK